MNLVLGILKYRQTTDRQTFNKACLDEHIYIGLLVTLYFKRRKRAIMCLVQIVRGKAYNERYRL